MKINTENFWENIGTVFNNTEDIKSSVSEKGKERGEEEFTVLPKGTYMIVLKDSHGYELYDINKDKIFLFEPGWIEDKDFDIFYMNPNETLDILITALNKKIIQLSSEGWVIDSENKYFDLSPYINFLDSIVKTKVILDQKES